MSFAFFCGAQLIASTRWQIAGFWDSRTWLSLTGVVSWIGLRNLRKSSEIGSFRWLWYQSTNCTKVEPVLEQPNSNSTHSWYFLVSSNGFRITDMVRLDASSVDRNFSSLIEIGTMAQGVMAASHCCSTNLNHPCERHKKHLLGLNTSGHCIHRHG